MVRYGKRVSKCKKTDDRVMRRRLVQLTVCVGLFVSVYVSKEVFPHKLQRLSENVSQLVGTTTDFQAAFSQLGEGLINGESVIGELGDFCIEVFGGNGEEEVVAVSDIDYPTLQSTPSDTSATQLIKEQFSAVEGEEEIDGGEEEAIEEELSEYIESSSDIYQSSALAVGAICQLADEDLRALPAGYTYDTLSLGDLEWTTPVLGVISSPFGYRIHPLSGQDTIHNGVDIVGAVGDPIYAFASGTVEYIGESDVYGLYFRIDHGNGVKTFYAHCSQLFISKGDTVTMGEIVAEVGATGDVTGPHLHLELSCFDYLIDPALYIDTL